jgi:hypothetical protein
VYRPSPTFVQRVHTPQRITAFIDVLGKDGIAALRALSGTNLKAADLKLSTTRVSYQQMETVFRTAARLANDLATRFGPVRRMHIMTYGMCGYALAEQPDPCDGHRFCGQVQPYPRNGRRRCVCPD